MSACAGPLTADKLDVIAGAGVGWRSALNEKTLRYEIPCSACRHFEMRMIKVRETDSFGHLRPTCNSPALPGGSGQPTLSTATCNHWEAKQ